MLKTVKDLLAVVSWMLTEHQALKKEITELRQACHGKDAQMEEMKKNIEKYKIPAESYKKIATIAEKCHDASQSPRVLGSRAV